MKNLQIAMVGCGGMASNYRHRYTQIDGAKLALVVDANEAVAKEAAQALGNIRWSCDFADALAPEIDMVDISTPNFLHTAQAVAAIEAGKHVIIQKPLAPSVAEAEAIVAAAKKTDKNVGMYMSMFNDPMMHDLKALVRSGMLGEIEGIHCRNAHRGGLFMPAGTWRGDLKKCGGGSFIQLAVHNIDFIQWLLEARIETVSAFSHNLRCSNVGGDDATTAACIFSNRILGTLESSYCADRSETSVYGTKGYFTMVNSAYLEMQIDNAFCGKVITYTTPGKLLRMPCSDTLELYKHPNPYDQSIAFVRAVLEGKPAPVSVDSGLYDLRVVQSVYASAKNGKAVDVAATN